MSDILGAYVATKTSTGAIKATEKTANGAIALTLMAIAIIFISVSPYFYYLFYVSNGNKIVPIKKLRDYKVRIGRILLTRRLSFLLIPTSLGATALVYVFIWKFREIFEFIPYGSNIMNAGYSLLIVFVINIVIVIMMYIFSRRGIAQKNKFLKFLDNYDEILSSPKSVVNQAAATHSRNSEEYTKILNIELDRLMNNIRDKYNFSNATLAVLESDSKKILDS